MPAFEADQSSTAVVEFHPFLGIGRHSVHCVGGHVLIHDFIDNDGIGDGEHICRTRRGRLGRLPDLLSRARPCGCLDDHGVDDLILVRREHEKFFIQSRTEPQRSFVQREQSARWQGDISQYHHTAIGTRDAEAKQ